MSKKIKSMLMGGLILLAANITVAEEIDNLGNGSFMIDATKTDIQTAIEQSCDLGLASKMPTSITTSSIEDVKIGSNITDLQVANLVSENTLALVMTLVVSTNDKRDIGVKVTNSSNDSDVIINELPDYVGQTLIICNPADDTSYQARSVYTRITKRSERALNWFNNLHEDRMNLPLTGSLPSVKISSYNVEEKEEEGLK